MKTRLVGALVGLAISFALPVFGQQTNTPDPQLRQELLALAKKFDDAFDNNDPAALGALFTEDAVMVEQSGPIYGREAIQKHWEDVFKKLRFSNWHTAYDDYSPHIISAAGIKAHTDALDKNDAAAVAANFTENGILVTPDGTFFGREAIEKYYESVFKQVQLSNNLVPVDDDSPHIIGTDGKEMWATGKYSATVNVRAMIGEFGCWPSTRSHRPLRTQSPTTNSSSK